MTQVSLSQHHSVGAPFSVAQLEVVDRRSSVCESRSDALNQSRLDGKCQDSLFSSIPQSYGGKINPIHFL